MLCVFFVIEYILYCDSCVVFDEDLLDLFGMLCVRVVWKYVVFDFEGFECVVY